ncbi:MAG: DNA-directed RNA polymerase subunit beta [Lachnospiraceae bacterium]|nr:DNA-directed RNA polymerase subunit beta [Lachnospiraceae bacterium]
MKASKMHPVKSGKNLRMSFSQREEIKDMPNLIDIQQQSYAWFITRGIIEVFKDIFPIEDPTGKIRLDFVSARLKTEDQKYDREECKQRNATFAYPLHVRFRLTKKEKNEVVENETYMSDLPCMTPNGSFIINGAERVVVSQMVRSPGIYYEMSRDKIGNKLYSSTLIPNRGAWIEYDSDANDIMWARVDRTRKVPITVFLRALGLSTDSDILELFGEEKYLKASMEKEPEDERNHDRGIIELYKKIRPGEQLSVDACESLFRNSLFDAKRYDLGRAGRYKYNKKLHFRYRLNNQVLAKDVIDESTGEVLARKGTKVTEQMAIDIQNAAIPYVFIKLEGEDEPQKILSSMMVDINSYVKGVKAQEWDEMGISELVYYPVLKNILEENKKNKEGKDALLETIAERSLELVPKHVTKEDILASINYFCHLSKGVGNTDDIDHLGNRRIRAVGELLQNQYRMGLSRLERVVKEKMVALQVDEMNIPSLINTKPVSAVIKEFFGSSQLSQFMDQNNPLSELTHKRRLSALGPGGISRERAGFEVRDVHYTHYGRVCPIETPEGPNIGLINSLATYARINKYGFIEAPYIKVDKETDPNNPTVLGDKPEDIVYMTADEEDNYHVAQANEPLDEERHFKNANVSGRYREETSLYRKQDIDYMDVSPRMVFSVATNMIPFLQNDDANRALMGSNMQRQAVPLMITESAAVGTGMEVKAAYDSGVCVHADVDGEVTYVDAKTIKVKADNGDKREYQLLKFSRSNQSNSYNQKPIVDVGQKVKVGEIIADGPSTNKGELALGKNPLIGFMTWEGYNYEDAVLISERLVKEDVYTSIHIEEYEIEARDTKLGPEEITNDIPNISPETLSNLNSDGIIRIGAEVRTGDILVGKLTPKGEQDLTAEEKLLRAIFKEKAKDFRDTSLKMPHGAYGTVIATRVFTRKAGDAVPAGVSTKVRVYVAQKRKISVGDKMAGRHGNKGVVSRVLPVEDMPYLPNGRPLDIVLNPLGVPSRMNIGQILETHLSLASKVLGIDICTPTFEGANEKDIQDTLEIANDYANMEWDDFKKKYENILAPDVIKYLGQHLDNRDEWKGVPIKKDGKVLLRDGRTGEYFDSPTTIGFMHYLKLHHLVDDKIHARSIGPYSLVTQQPLGGKAQFGGQRFGEMEVWALEAYGAAYTLQEILTVKSDDMVGRVKSYENIIKGQNMQRPTIPESFKVLLKELQALCLDLTVLDGHGNEVPMLENLYDPREEMRKFMEGNDRKYVKESELKDMGFMTQKFNNSGQLVNVDEEGGNDNE